MNAGGGARPPRPWRFLARLVIQGERAEDIRRDLDQAFARDLERGLGRPAARRRYATNVLGSAWSVALTGLTGFVTRGTLLDAKLGVRMLRRQPLLTVVAMLALGLGIPASLSVNHALHVIFAPLPVPGGDRVMGIRYWDSEARAPRAGSVHDYEHWTESLTSFQSFGAARGYSVNVHEGNASAPPVGAADVTASTFGLLRATPRLGRVFSEADEVRDAPDVVLISEDLWTSRFAGDPGIVGRTVRVGNRQHTVVGVMPIGFQFPDDNDVWLPLRAAPADYPVGEGPSLWVYGRLADGVDTEDAKLEMELVTARAVADEPNRLEHVVGEVVSMPVLFFGENDLENEPGPVVLQAIMIVLLLIICGNVGTLLLARTATRSAEISIRSALGASRARIVTQLFVEALVLSVASTGLGLMVLQGFASFITRTMATAGTLPYWIDPSLTPRIVLLALGLAVLSGAVAGVIPALKATGKGVQTNLQRAGVGGATIRFGWGSTALIVTEVVLSVGFLAICSVMIRSAFQSTEGKLGFEPERYVSASLRLSPPDAPDAAAADDAAFDLKVRETQQEVLERVRRDTDVVGVGLALHHPAYEGALRSLVIEDASGGQERAPTRAYETRVGGGYLHDLGRPILAGRDFTAADLTENSGPRPVVVNTGFVEQMLGGRNAVGVRFRHAVQGDVAPEDEEWFEIVGVVGPFGVNTLNPTRDAGYYLPFAPGTVNPVRYLVEVAGDPEAFLPRFREIVAEVDPEAITGGNVMADIMRTESRLLRGLFSMLILIAAIAFLLAVMGLYALMSFTVSQRTREIGIRTALGARAWSIVSTIARRAGGQLAVGLVLGTGWGWLLLGQVVNDESMIPTNRPLTLAATVSCAALVGLLACLSPTLRGLRIQPTEALREQ